MKNFQKFRQNLSESELVQENNVALPPNILILRRQTVRQFAGHTLVALYYNDKLDQYFSIPFGGAEDSIITPSPMKEETLLEVNLSDKDHEVIKAFMNKKPHSSKKLSTDGKKLDGNWMGGSGIAHHSEHGLHLNELGSKSAQQVHRAIKKHNSYDSHSDVPHYKNIIHEAKDFAQFKEEVTEVIEENVIEHLRSIKEFHTRKAIKHGDGKQTTVDPTTAHALLTVHDALSDENKKKFAEHLGKSKHHFNKMLDFTWKSVK